MTQDTAALFVKERTITDRAYKCLRVNGFGLKYFEPGERYTRDEVKAYPHPEQVRVIK